MQETQKFFETTPATEREETIVRGSDGALSTPRFDEVEAQVARPVVPLSGRPARSVRRQWPIALVLISALAGGVVSLLAFRLYQQRQSQAVAAQAESRTSAADATQSPAPTPAIAAATTTEEQAQSGAPVVFEEFDPSKEGGAVSDAAPSRPKAEEAAPPTPARREEARDESKPSPRPVETLKPRRTETSPAPRQVEARHEDTYRDGGGGGEDEDLRERRRERRQQRREQRREQRRNIDRIKDIFEGAPPS